MTTEPANGASAGQVRPGRRVSSVTPPTSAASLTVATRVAIGHPAQELVRAAKEIGADLIVLGHSGHSAIWGTFLGTVTERVSRHAPCSVLIVR